MRPGRLCLFGVGDEAAAGGGFFAYYKDNLLCSAYGETPDEAYENLERVIDDFISDMYMVEEYV